LKRHNINTSLKDEEVEEAKSRASDDDKIKWFRPSDVVVGPDGAIYIADWYDGVVGGHRMIDSTGYGRIYRITPKGKKLSVPEINLSTTQGQIEALMNPAVNVRNAGFELLAEKGDEVLERVKAILHDNNPYHQARAIWLLSKMGPAGQAHVESMLLSSNPQLRITAFRALRQVKPEILSYAQQLADDASPAVRREVAVALRDLPFEEIKDIVVELASPYEGEDRYYLEALGLAMEGKEEQFFPVLNDEMGEDPLDWNEGFEDIVWRIHPKAAIPFLHQRAVSDQMSTAQQQKSIVALGFIHDQKAVNALEEIAAGDNMEAKNHALWWLRYRRNNEWRDFNMEIPEMEASISPELQKEMLEFKAILENENASMEEKTKAATTMAKDITGGKMLIALAEGKKLSEEIIAAVSKVIFDNPEEPVRVLAADYFPNPKDAPEFSLTQIASIEGDPAKGKTVYQGKCATCHRIGDQGRDIGPDLSTIGAKLDQSGLLDAIVNPSAGMAFGYEMWLITKNDGTIATGFLQADGEMVVLKGMNGEVYNIKASDIATRKQFETSIMPPPSGLNIGEEDMANLTAYLSTLR
jgi:putative heme-binding domain-containing protein